MRPALPVAHLARVQSADVLRAKRPAEERDRQQQGNPPGECGGAERRRTLRGKRCFGHAYRVLDEAAADAIAGPFGARRLRVFSA